MSQERIARRDFLKGAALATAGLAAAGSQACAVLRPGPRRISPNEKLNVACIGVGGRGHDNVHAMSGENIVALCDVDDSMAAEAYAAFPSAQHFHDYRRMLDKLERSIDAVVISTPDHMHALPALTAMEMGKHVYLEKPLAHDVFEARRLAETARRYGVATQMGNQGTADPVFRKGVAAIRAGVIGAVRDVHIWTNRPVWPQGMARPDDTPEVPETLKWDLWLGTAPWRPYHPSYLPFNWRGWWDFGTGALGDMGCHTANLAFMGLGLGSPISAHAENSAFSRDSFPTWSVITLHFPARGTKPPVRWTWYDGSDQKPAWVLERLRSLIHGQELSDSGMVMIGDKGTLYSPHDYGAHWLLLPEEDFAGYEPPAEALLAESPGHHQEWIDACKGGKPALSNFSYAGPLTEALLIGNIAMYCGEMILWDGEACRVRGNQLANSLVRREYRHEW
ncbi:MAG: Gfo/Idh/MocA family oxidoreductase [Planctomycetes bacterium]|nr:Gfo/Idh/MocA family oxidoreductase [Planctomycetota bacterium]